MKNRVINFRFSQLIQIFTFFLLIFSIGCGSGTGNKVDTVKRDQNGPGGQNPPFGKPTPQIGNQALAYTALSMIAINEVIRVVDLAQGGAESLGKCLEAPKNLGTKDGTTQLKFAAQGQSCAKKIINLEENITVIRNDKGQITKISKKSIREVKISFDKDEKLERDIAFGSDIDISLIKDNRYSFVLSNGKYAYRLRENRKNSNRYSEKSAFGLFVSSGELSISSAPTRVYVKELGFEHTREKNDKPIFNNLVVVNSLSENKELSLVVCNRPIGQYFAKQTFQVVNNKKEPGIYSPNFEISSDGIIEIPNAKLRFKKTNCSPALEDIDDLIIAAEGMIDRVATAVLLPDNKEEKDRRFEKATDGRVKSLEEIIE